MSALLLILILGIFIFAAFHHVIIIAIAHLFHPHFLGIFAVIGAVVVGFLLLVGLVAHKVQVGAPAVVAVQQAPMVPAMPNIPFPNIAPPNIAPPNVAPPNFVPPVPATPAIEVYQFPLAESVPAEHIAIGPSWIKLSLLLAAVIGVLGFVALVNGKIRIPSGVAPAIGLVLLMFGVFFAVVTLKRIEMSRNEKTATLAPSGYTDYRAVMEHAAADRQSHEPAKKRSSKTPKTQQVAENDASASATVGAEAELNPDAASGNDAITPATEKSGAEKSSETKTAAGAPRWINDSAQRRGDLYTEVVKAKHEDPNFRDELLNSKLLETANRFIDEAILHRPGIGAELNFSGPWLRERFVTAEYPTASTPPDAVGTEEYALLQLDSDFRKEVLHRFQTIASRGRLEQAGTISIAALILLGGLYVFLRYMPPRVSLAMPMQSMPTQQFTSTANDASAALAMEPPIANPVRRTHWVVRVMVGVAVTVLILWTLLAVFWSVAPRMSTGI